MRQMRCTPPTHLGVVMLALSALVAGCGGGLSGDAVGSGRAIGTVTLPPGSSPGLSDLTVRSDAASASVSSDGSFKLAESGSGPSLVSVYDARGNLVMMGYANLSASKASGSQISPMSTAKAMVFLDLGAFTLPSSEWGAALDLIGAVSEVQTLGTVIGQRIAADPTALESGDAQIAAALAAVRAKLRPASTKAAVRAPAGAGSTIAAKLTLSRASANGRAVLQYAVTSANPQSGIQVGENPDGDGIILTNERRRHCWYWIYRTGYQDSAGTDRTLAVKNWVQVSNGYVSSTNALSGVIGSTLDALWDNVAYKPAVTGPLTLPFEPADAKKATYTVFVMGPGHGKFTIDTDLATSPDLNNWANSQHGMACLSFLKDFLLPTVFTFISADAVNQRTTVQLTEAAVDIVGACSQAGLDVGTALEAGDALGALKSFMKAIATDELLRKTVAEIIARKVLARAASTTVLAKITAVAEKLCKVLKAFDILFYGVDIGACQKDWWDSDDIVRFDVVSQPPSIRFEPTAPTVQPAGSVALVVYKGSIGGAQFRYKWQTPGKHGKIQSGTYQGWSLQTNDPNITYVCNSDAAVGDTETVSVKIERADSLSSSATWESVGSASVTVTVVSAQPGTVPTTFTSFGPEFMVSGGTKYIVYGYLVTWTVPSTAVWQLFPNSSTRHGIPFRYKLNEYNQSDPLNLLGRLGIDETSNYSARVDALVVDPANDNDTENGIIFNNIRSIISGAQTWWAPGVRVLYN